MSFALGTSIENHWQDRSSDKLRFVHTAQILVIKMSCDCQWPLVCEQILCGNYSNKFWLLLLSKDWIKQATGGEDELRYYGLESNGKDQRHVILGLTPWLGRTKNSPQNFL
jgi:hypothetical protein